MFGEIVSGALGYLGAADTNRANAKISNARNLMEVEEARKARMFSRDQALLNRQFQDGQAKQMMTFQDRMSSTAVQRRMKDMRAAGINPILAGKFDASSPAGAMGSGGIGATAKANAHGYTAINKMEALLGNLGTALQLKKLGAETKNIEANTKFTDRKKDMTDPVNSVMELLQGVIDKYVGGDAKTRKGLSDKVEEETKRIINSHREGQKIRNSPGIELTDHSKKSQQKLKYSESKKSRSKNRSRGR